MQLPEARVLAPTIWLWRIPWTGRAQDIARGSRAGYHQYQAQHKEVLPESCQLVVISGIILYASYLKEMSIHKRYITEWTRNHHSQQPKLKTGHNPQLMSEYKIRYIQKQNAIQE